jgi:hypothetical protein
MGNLKPQIVYLPVSEAWVEGKPTLMSSDGEWVCNLYQNIGYFFTPEQLNQHIEDIIKDTLRVAAEKATMKLLIDEENDIVQEANIDKESITDTFNQTYNKWKI